MSFVWRRTGDKATTSQWPSNCIGKGMQTTKAWLIGGGVGSLAAAAFMIRDGAISGENITIFEALPLMGGRMLTSDNYECTWDLFKSIPSLIRPDRTVFEETMEFNQQHKAHSLARLVDRRRAKVPVESMGFSMEDRLQLLKLSQASEEELGTDRITDWLAPAFFETEFWYMWVTTFAFQPWHSAVEFKRYLLRFALEFTRIETLAGVKRTIYNQYDSLVRPLQAWLAAQGVHLIHDCTVTSIDNADKDGEFTVTGLHCEHAGKPEFIAVSEGDLVFLQNGSMTDASSLGSMSAAPPKLTKADSSGWMLWENLAKGRPEFGRPEVFNGCIAQSCWESFTVTLKTPAFFNAMTEFTGNEPGTGGLVTFKDSNWLMSVVLAAQPHFANQPVGVQVFWGYALLPDRIGNFIPKAMADCSGAEILDELRGHLRFDADVFSEANCIPCRMPYITSMFMPRAHGDRPLPVPPGSKNFAFISQFVEIPEDVVFTVEYSVRAAQTAVYRLLKIERAVPPVTPHARSVKTQLQVLRKAM